MSEVVIKVSSPKETGGVSVSGEQKPTVVNVHPSDATSTIEAKSSSKETVTVVEESGKTGPPGPPGRQGEQGEPGPQGPEGPAGASGDVYYTHDQTALASTWTVDHNLGRHPATFAEDAMGTLIYGTVKHLSNNTLTITFAVTLTGRVNCT